MEKVRNSSASSELSKEEKAINQLRSRLGHIIKPQHDDKYLRKWLQARKFDVGAAEKMFRDSMAYRERMDVDNILENYEAPEVLRKYLSVGFCGHDKEGSPIRVDLFGNVDIKGIMYSAKKVELEKIKIQQAEQSMRDFKELSERFGREVDGWTAIIDLENLGAKTLWRPGVHMYMHLMKVLEDNYPEMMKRIFVVHAPRIFPLLWKILRPLLTDDMKKKMFVLGADAEKVLLEYIDADQLPAYLGGTLTDPDGNTRCTTLINPGGEVPRHYYLTEAISTDDMEHVIVGRGDCYKVKVVVIRSGSIIRWEFITEDHDIGFGLTFKGDSKSSSKDTIVKTERVDCYMVPEEGLHICEKAGTYTVIFDNTYSWTRSKRLCYTLELHVTDDSTETDIDDISSGGSWTRLSKDLLITRL